MIVMSTDIYVFVKQQIEHIRTDIVSELVLETDCERSKIMVYELKALKSLAERYDDIYKSEILGEDGAALTPFQRMAMVDDLLSGFGKSGDKK